MADKKKVKSYEEAVEKFNWENTSPDEQKEVILRKICSYYGKQRDWTEEVIEEMLAAVEKYHPKQIFDARPYLYRNEVFFDVKKLSDIIDEFQLQPPPGPLPEPRVKLEELAGMSWSDWRGMTDDAEMDDDQERGEEVLRRMREEPESFNGTNPYDEWYGRDTVDYSDAITDPTD